MTDAPKRVQLSRAKGWRKPEGAIVVARPTKHGNPYTVGVGVDGADRRCGWRVRVEGIVVAGPYATRAEASAEAVRLYVALRGPGGEAEIAPDVLAELRGHDLACWCPLTDDAGDPWPCHATPLLRWANVGLTLRFVGGQTDPQPENMKAPRIGTETDRGA